MRLAARLFLVPVLFSSGCAASLARLGTDPTKLETKEEVRAQFGEPDKSGVVEGLCYEEYSTRRKIATEAPWAEGEVMFFAMTLGLIEIPLLSHELYRTTKGAAAGQRLRFTYDHLGRVIRIDLDGESERFLIFNLTHRDQVTGVPGPGKSPDEDPPPDDRCLGVGPP
jgi:YD repeat-containing protein